MEQEALFTRVRLLAKDLDTLITDVRGYTYVDVKALELAQMQAQMLLMALTVAIQGVVSDHSA